MEGIEPSRLVRLLEGVLLIAADLSLPVVLRRLVEAACDLVEADYGALGVIGPDRMLAEFITVGATPETIAAIGDLPLGHGILGLLIVEPQPLRLPNLAEHPDSYGFPPHHPPMKSFLGVPIRARGEVFGNLYLTEKRGAAEFSSEDEKLAIALASAAGVAIENARLHARVAELGLLADRERIARDLHDSVIQRLFAVGLNLQGTARLAQRPEIGDRIHRAVDEIDTTIRDIRATIFALESRAPGGPRGFRSRVIALAAEATASLTFAPVVHFSGPVETVVSDGVADQLMATLREAISNVAQHATASQLEIEIEAGREIVLRVADNGVGLPSTPAGDGHGLRNMGDRARALGGVFTVGRRTGPGTLLEWRVPADPG